MSRDLDELERVVARMRALGVARWGDIELGPEPHTAEPRELTPEEEARRARRAIEARHRIMFASSRVVPPLPVPVSTLEQHALARKGGK